MKSHLVLACVLVASFTPTVLAQDNSVRIVEYDPKSARSDHARVVNHFGVGFFGVQDVPVVTTEEPVNAPSLGARYWFSERFGFEAAAGFYYRTGSNDVGIDPPTRYAFSLHGGVPWVWMHSGHYKFLVIPEINLAFGGGKDYGATSANDTKYSSVLFELGARAGAEIHFGFINVPQLSLQATVGVRARNLSTTRETGGTSTSGSVFEFATTVQDPPWGIFLSNLAAIYYF